VGLCIKAAGANKPIRPRGLEAALIKNGGGVMRMKLAVLFLFVSISIMLSGIADAGDIFCGFEKKGYVKLKDRQGRVHHCFTGNPVVRLRTRGGFITRSDQQLIDWLISNGVLRRTSSATYGRVYCVTDEGLRWVANAKNKPACQRSPDAPPPENCLRTRVNRRMTREYNNSLGQRCRNYDIVIHFINICSGVTLRMVHEEIKRERSIGDGRRSIERRSLDPRKPDLPPGTSTHAGFGAVHNLVTGFFHWRAKGSWIDKKSKKKYRFDLGGP
jgi:hypothetical protein